MKDLLNMVLGSQNDEVINQIGKQVSLEPEKTRHALNHILPTIKHALNKNSQQANGLESLLSALKHGNNDEYIDKPEKLEQPGAVDNGNAILGHLLGSKDSSRQLAEQVSNQTGIDKGILKQMLPLAANFLMGSLSKETKNQPEERGFLHQMLDLDNDNSVLDDATNFIGKLF